MKSIYCVEAALLLAICCCPAVYAEITGTGQLYGYEAQETYPVSATLTPNGGGSYTITMTITGVGHEPIWAGDASAIGRTFTGPFNYDPATGKVSGDFGPNPHGGTLQNNLTSTDGQHFSGEIPGGDPQPPNQWLEYKFDPATPLTFDTSLNGGGVGVAPSITSLLQASATVGTAFTYTIKASGDATITYAATNLPDGLTAAGAAISGTPTTAGTFNITLTATNSAGTDTQTLVLTVVGKPVITSPLTASGTVYHAFNYQITASGNPASYNATGLPAGLTMDSTGLISGTPTAIGPGSVLLSATNDVGTGTATLTITIAVATPAVNDIEPSSGPLAGGTSVVISGSNFLGVTAVTFGDAPTTGVVVNSDNQVTVTAPPHTAGTVTVTVANPSASGSGTFTYVPPPTLAGIAPASGSHSGGDTVTLTGTDLADALSVTFGEIAATIMDNTTAVSITVTTPARTTGTGIPVVVTTASGTAQTTFTYTNSAPTIGSMQLSPNPPFAGWPAELAVTTDDPDHDARTVSIDWGDGTSGTATAHTYADVGPYTVTVSVTDGIAPAVTKTMGPVIPVAPPEFYLQKMSGTFKFNNYKPTDSCSVSGLIPAQDTTQRFNSKDFQLNAGGATISVKLDANGAGKGKSAAGSVALKVKYTKGAGGKTFIGGDVPFTVLLKGSYWKAWENCGIVATTDMKGDTIQMPVSLMFDTQFFAVDAVLAVKSKATKNGSFKLVPPSAVQ